MAVGLQSVANVTGAISAGLSWSLFGETMALIDRIRQFATAPNAATQMAAYGPFPSYKPIAESRIAKCEERLGFGIPQLYRQLLSEVGNGGFGLGYGTIGIGKRGALDDLDQDLVAVYRMHKKGPKDCPNWRWRDGLLAFCYYGCACYACVDCIDKSHPVYRFDPTFIQYEGNEPLARALRRESKSLELWFEKWLRETRKRLRESEAKNAK